MAKREGPRDWASCMVEAQMRSVCALLESLDREDLIIKWRTKPEDLREDHDRFWKEEEFAE